MMQVLSIKSARPVEGLTNPFKLPRGERLRLELVRVFAEQRRAMIRHLDAGEKDGTDGILPGGRLGRGFLRRPGLDGLFDRVARKDNPPPPPPAGWPDFDDLHLGALAMSERFAPLLVLTWEAAAQRFAPRVGLDPDAWSVVNPHTEAMIEHAALAFAQSTNDTTSRQLDQALGDLRRELTTGIVELGEALSTLTDRVNAIFDQASRSRARRIAWTETSRAVHSAQEQAAIHSGVVTGWKWLLSSDSCPLCTAIAARTPAVKLGQPFAIIGSDPNYSTVKFPPAHPHCRCSLIEVLDTDDQPAWGDTLHDPDPATDEETGRLGAEIAARDRAILAGSAKRMRPAPARRAPKLARKRLRRPTEVTA